MVYKSKASKPNITFDQKISIKGVLKYVIYIVYINKEILMLISC